ncbi:MAG: hypothetical protein WCC41_17865 [Rhodomicrobium sp.]
MGKVTPEMKAAPSLNRKPYSVLVAYVGGGALHLAAVVLDLSHNLVELRLIAADHNNDCPEPRQFTRRAAPDPAPAAGHNVQLPLEQGWAEDTAIALALAHGPFPDFPQS